VAHRISQKFAAVFRVIIIIIISIIIINIIIDLITLLSIGRENFTYPRLSVRLHSAMGRKFFQSPRSRGVS